MPRWLAHLLVTLGWLLTPFWAWGASFFGAWVGARVAARWSDPVIMVGVVVGVAAATGLGGLWLWITWMRRLPHRLSHRMAPRRPSAEAKAAPGD